MIWIEALNYTSAALVQAQGKQRHKGYDKRNGGNREPSSEMQRHAVDQPGLTQVYWNGRRRQQRQAMSVQQKELTTVGKTLSTTKIQNKYSRFSSP